MGNWASLPSVEKDNDNFLQALEKRDPDLLQRLRAFIEEDAHSKLNPASYAATATTGDLPHRSIPESVFDSTQLPQLTTTVGEYVFPFENLVFEGGGGKGLIYYGALKCLSDAGIKCKRFAGASAGAITSMLMAINLTLDEVNEYMNVDMAAILNDHSNGWLSLVPNLLRYFGWNPGEKFLHYLGEVLEKHTGDKDITFEGVYVKYGNELCVMVMNVNLQYAEFCHVKTTPDMPIRKAVRMSMSIPGYFAAVPNQTKDGATDYYVDGGFMCNYPILAYDGWWLSMKPEDAFFKKLRPISDIPNVMDVGQRFGTYNDRTLGFLLFSTGEKELFQRELEKQNIDVKVPRPDTALYRKKQAEAKEIYDALLANESLVEATDRFADALAGKFHADKSTISMSEFQSVFANLKQTEKDGKFSQADAVLLFGEKYDISHVFQSIDLNKDGLINYSELSAMLDKSLSKDKRFLGYQRCEISNVFEFAKTLIDSLQLQSKKVYMKATDLARTVGLDTDYVGTMDFSIEPADHQFLYEQGYRITEAFLMKYAKAHGLPKKTH